MQASAYLYISFSILQCSVSTTSLAIHPKFTFPPDPCPDPMPPAHFLPLSILYISSFTVQPLVIPLTPPPHLTHVFGNILYNMISILITTLKCSLKDHQNLCNSYTVIFNTIKSWLSYKCEMKMCCLKSTLCGYNKIPKAGCFIKERGLFSFLFWRLKVQDQEDPHLFSLCCGPLPSAVTTRYGKKRKGKEPHSEGPSILDAPTL